MTHESQWNATLPTPIPGPVHRLLKSLYGSLDADSIFRHIVREAPPLLKASGIRGCLWEPGRACRSWSGGLCPPVRHIGVDRRSDPLPLRLARRGISITGRMRIVGDREVLIVVRRADGAMPFTAADEDFLFLLLEHMVRALEGAYRYAGARQSAQFLSAAMDLVPWPVFILDEFGHIFFRNRASVPALAGAEAPLVLTAAAREVALFRERRPTGLRTGLITLDGGWQLQQVGLPDGGAGLIVSRPAYPGYLEAASEALTEREGEVAQLVAAGLTNVQIAGSLFITVNTVKRHLKSAFRKLQVGSRAELVAVLSRSRQGGG